MYWCEWTLIQNSEHWMKTEDCCGSLHHHENVKRLDWSYEDHEISLKNSENIQHVVIICFHQKQTSFKWMEETVSLTGLRSSLNINCFKSWKKGECWRVLLFLIDQKLWERLWVIQLFENEIEWNDLWVVWEQRDWFCQWIILRWWVCDSVMWTGSRWRERKNWICLGWVGCCVCPGAGDCPSERRATHLFFQTENIQKKKNTWKKYGINLTF